MQEAFMRQAIGLALQSVRCNSGPFGAVVIRNGQVIGQGHNEVTLKNDPTAHAEMVAIRRACQTLGVFQLQGCEIYSSCEPCPMCLGAIYWAHLDKVYFAASQVDAAGAGFDDAHLYQQFALPMDQRRLPMVQILRTEAQLPFAEWQKLPNKIQY
jgi:guanine deaminase